MAKQHSQAFRPLTKITKDLGKIVGENDPAKAVLRDKRLREEMHRTGPVNVRQA